MAGQPALARVWRFRSLDVDRCHSTGRMALGAFYTFVPRDQRAALLFSGLSQFAFDHDHGF